ncbi:MAG: threonine ammonia-lyase [Longimicrobiales bacterium]
MELLSRSAFEDAWRWVRPSVHYTPLLSFHTLGKRLGTPAYLKCENLQKTGSFKVRGALNAIAALDDAERHRGVVTISAGNHAQAVAWAAAQSGIRSKIVMPETASPIKVVATEGYGGEVVLHGTSAEAFVEAGRIAEEEGLVFLHPFDAEAVVAGHGSVGLELEEQLPGPLQVVVPVGGGGQISGVAGALATGPDRHRVFGVEPVGASAMKQSLEAGTPVTLESTDTIADGLAPPMAGTINFQYVQSCVEDVVTVSDDEILQAMALIMTRAKQVVEPSGAAAVAALMFGKVPLTTNAPVVAILSGGNVDAQWVSEALDRGFSWP